MLLSHTVPPTHKRAAAFALSRMLTTGFRHRVIVSNIVLPVLHGSFLHVSPHTEDQDGRGMPSDAPSSLRKREPLTLTVALSTLMILLTNTDPSPTLISTLLSPIVPALYTLLFYLDDIKTSDPGMTESLRCLLTTWGRVVSSHEGIQILWRILDGEGGEWEIDLEQNPKRVERRVIQVLK
jgi:hypothetical protein